MSFIPSDNQLLQIASQTHKPVSVKKKLLLNPLPSSFQAAELPTDACTFAYMRSYKEGQSKTAQWNTRWSMAWKGRSAKGENLSWAHSRGKRPPPGLVVRLQALGTTHLPFPPIPASSLSIGLNTREQTVSIGDHILVLVTATSSGPRLQNKCNTRHL